MERGRERLVSGPVALRSLKCPVQYRASGREMSSRKVHSQENAGQCFQTTCQGWMRETRCTWNVTFPISRKTLASIFNYQSGKADELSAQGRTGPERQEHAGMQPRRDANGGALGRGPSTGLWSSLDQRERGRANF